MKSLLRICLAATIGLFIVSALSRPSQAGTFTGGPPVGPTQVTISYTGLVAHSTNQGLLPDGSTISGSFYYVVKASGTPHGIATSTDTTYNYTGSTAGHGFTINFAPLSPAAALAPDRSLTNGSYILDLNSPNALTGTTMMTLSANSVDNPSNNSAVILSITGLNLPSNALPTMLPTGYTATLSYDPPNLAFDVPVLKIMDVTFNQVPDILPEPSSIVSAVLGLACTSTYLWRRRYGGPATQNVA